MEIVLQAVEVAGALPLAHGEVVQQVVAAGLRLRGGNLVLGEDPLEALDGQAAHVVDGVVARHDDIHAREATHGADVDHVVFRRTVAEPGGHEVFQTVNGGRRHGGLLVGLGDAQVECGEALVLAGNVDARLEVGVVDGETCDYFHN